MMSETMAINTLWVLLAAALVFFMQAGFAMVEAGFTRAKNTGNIIMKNLMDFSVGSLVYWVLGFSLMFGVSRSGLVGSVGFFSSGAFDHLGLDIPTEAFLIFQTVFCATAATIVSGAMAERTKFKSYLIYSFFISALVYPVAGHWIWGGGWLENLGFHDFAGSTVVHSLGGWAALAGAWIIGPRLGKYGKNGSITPIKGHNLALGALGVFILWFGWFGFNGGSTLEADPVAMSHIFVTTNLAAAMGAIMAMVVSWNRYGKPDLSITLNGALAGLVGITAGTDIVSPLGAACIGAMAGMVAVVAIEWLDQKLRIDDPVGAISVHGICGALGTVLTGVFATDGGLLYGGGPGMLLVQLVGVGAIALWTLSTTLLLFKAIEKTVGLRVSPEEEALGLDLKEHGTESYADFEPRVLLEPIR